MRRQIEYNRERKVGGHLAQKLWRLGRVGTASRIVQ
jgi:hypothetical protein